MENKNKTDYKSPTLNVFQYSVEEGYALSSNIPLDPSEPEEPSGCNCKAYNCMCNKRSECTGSRFDGCHPKY